MGFLTPLFLAAAAAVAVPLLLHLLDRRSGKRRPFPALRYLRRTEREHARSIRLRQILLLLLRATVILLLVAAGARLFLQGEGADHEPTALAIVLDNSISSGVVRGDERLLDRLKRTALTSVASATAEDRIWVLRAGEPWETPVPGGAAAARRRIEETEVRGVETSLPETVARARSLVAAAGMPAGEVHVLSDLQEFGFSGTSGAPASENQVPVILLERLEDPPANRYVSSVAVGGGLPPLVDQATEIGVGVDATEEWRSEENGDTARVRLVLGDRVVAAGEAPLGSTVLLPAGPFPLEEVVGSVEIDPDALGADDRRYFTFRVRAPPRVAVDGEPGRFLDDALDVLQESDRIRRVESGEVDVAIAAGGEGLQDGARPSGATIVLAPEDPALLPATNRRLQEGGVPWRLQNDPAEGETGLQVEDLPVELDDVRVRRSYRLVPSGETAEGTVRVRQATGEPWMVSGSSSEGWPYLLLASPLRPEATSLPLSARMLPLVEWMISGWPPTFRTEPSVEAGRPLSLPAGASTVRSPDGTLHPVDGRQPFQATGEPGIYAALDGDSVLVRMAVNPPVGESLLERLDPDEVRERLGAPVQTVEDVDAWSSRIFLRRHGHELWRPLLVAALLLLLGEGLLATAGGPSRRADREKPRAGKQSPGAPEGASVS